MQRTPAWFNARRGKLTASNFGTAAGVNPYQSRNKYLLAEAGIDPKFTGNDATRWGTVNEANAIKDYQVRTGNIVRAYGFKLHDDYAWLGGSPDGLVGKMGMIEVKCPFIRQTPHDKIPPHYYCQINGLLEIFDRQWCDFISWTPTQFKVYRVYRDPELWDLLLGKYTSFFAAMSRGAVDFPRQQRGEKQETLDAIAASDAHTEYAFWRMTEPAHLRGVWEAPFNDPFLDYDDNSEDSDDAGPIRKLPKRESSETAEPGVGADGGGSVHVCATPSLSRRLTNETPGVGQAEMGPIACA